MKSILLIVTAFASVSLFAQENTDSTKTVILKNVTITGIKTVKGTGHMPEMKDGIVYAGKKN